MRPFLIVNVNFRLSRGFIVVLGGTLWLSVHGLCKMRRRAFCGVLLVLEVFLPMLLTSVYP